jgi:hypothetical protein
MAAPRSRRRASAPSTSQAATFTSNSGCVSTQKASREPEIDLWPHACTRIHTCVQTSLSTHPFATLFTGCRQKAAPRPLASSTSDGWRRQAIAGGGRGSSNTSAADAARRQGNATLALHHASAREGRAEKERERGSASPRAAAGETQFCNLSLTEVATVTPLTPDKKPPYCNICHRRAISGARLCPHYFVKMRVGQQARRHANSSIKPPKPLLVLCKRHQAVADALAE